MTGEPSVTVVVPVLNRRERMLRCLDAVLGQRYVSYDVLVLDTGSSDGTPEACVERASGSELERLAKPGTSLDVKRPIRLAGVSNDAFCARVWARL